MKNAFIKAHRGRCQSQEMDDELKGKGNSVNYKYRMHYPRLGRFFAVDSLPHPIFIRIFMRTDYCKYLNNIQFLIDFIMNKIRKLFNLYTTYVFVFNLK